MKKQKLQIMTIRTVKSKSHLVTFVTQTMTLTRYRFSLVNKIVSSLTTPNRLDMSLTFLFIKAMELTNLENPPAKRRSN